MKPIKAYSIVHDDKLDAMEIYQDKDVVINKGEKLIRVIIKPDEDKKYNSVKEKAR